MTITNCADSKFSITTSRHVSWSYKIDYSLDIQIKSCCCCTSMGISFIALSILLCKDKRAQKTAIDRNLPHHQALVRPLTELDHLWMMVQQLCNVLTTLQCQQSLHLALGRGDEGCVCAVYPLDGSRNPSAVLILVLGAASHRHSTSQKQIVYQRMLLLTSSNPKRIVACDGALH